MTLRSAAEILAEAYVADGWKGKARDILSGNFAPGDERTLSAIEQAQREAIEEAAKVADLLGGDRERLPMRDGNDAEARTGRAMRAQHVRAKSIATAIRSLGKDGGAGG